MKGADGLPNDASTLMQAAKAEKLLDQKSLHGMLHFSKKIANLHTFCSVM